MLAVQPYLHKIVDRFSHPSIQTILFLFGELVLLSKLTQKCWMHAFRSPCMNGESRHERMGLPFTAFR